MFDVSFLSFFIVLLAAVFFSSLFRRLHLPWAVALIIAGILIGPHATGIFTPNETISFMGEIGLVFLMFMAGLEMRFTSFQQRLGSISFVAFFNGILPFGIGFVIALAFGFSIQTALLLGVIFISSSVAVVVPSISSHKLLNTRLGNAIIGSTMLQDIASLVLLSVLFQTGAPETNLPLPLFYSLLLVFLVFLRWIIPRIETFFARQSIFQQELRSVLLVLIGTVVIFELLGLHAIIAGFFAGLVLSDSLRGGTLKEKLRVVSYGIFIPIFFIVVGAETNVRSFDSAQEILVLVSAIVLGSIISKLVSGYLAGRVSGFTPYESKLIAATSVPQLSTTLAVAFSGFSFGLITQDLLTALVILSITTTIIAPVLTQYFITQKKSPLSEATSKK